MRVRREDADDLLHAADDDPNFNESRYYSFFDRDLPMGGWIRMGNRPNEGYAEMTVCLYLPDSSVGFMFGRPKIDGHTAHHAGGLRFDVIEPYREHHVSYSGKVCVLENPRDMADPKSAFSDNPHEPCSVDLTLRAVAQPTGGEPEYEEGEEPEAGHGFARGHTEQQMASVGTIAVGERQFDLSNALGLRDHSWGPRVWQSIRWYRWVTASFGRLGIAATMRGDEDPSVRHVSGYVYDIDRYGDDRAIPVRDMELHSDYDDEFFPLRNRAVVTTDDHAYELSGEIWSAIPLRNRRGGQVTRLTESATMWTCGAMVGTGMSEYLDQVVEDRPVGLDVGT